MKSTCLFLLNVRFRTVRPFAHGFSARLRQYTFAPRTLIRTLKPECLQTIDFVIISNTITKQINTVLENGEVATCIIQYGFKRTRIPENTQGFLYYYRDPRFPSGTGEIRFRVTKSPDPASFKDGFDLLRPDGKPWSISIALAQPLFREVAYQDGLIDSNTRRPRAKYKFIRTLRPGCLRSYVSSTSSAMINAVLEKGKVVRGSVYYATDKKFPENTQGFLYCHYDPRLPFETGEIRFKITQNPDPASFKNGFDLLRPDGEPWSIRLALSQSPFWELAIQDGFVAHTGVFKKRNIRRGQCLAFLEQPFVLDLETQRKTLAIVTPREVVKIPSLSLIYSNTSRPRRSYLKGKLLVSFELPAEGVLVNGISVVMRVLKVLEPIEPLSEDAIVYRPFPTPGTLVKFTSRGQSRIAEFESSSLQLIPSIKTPTPSPLHGPVPVLPKIYQTLFTDRSKTISTLDPRRLQPSDFTILSNRIKIYSGDNMSNHKSQSNSASLESNHFLPNTHGFLYMHINPRLPLVSGQIRFRITPSSDPAQFENGTDLLLRCEPWNIHALRIARNDLLKEQLHHDGYVEYVQALSNLPTSKMRTVKSLYYLEQPFVMDLSHRYHTLQVILSDS
ncbi:hypothetical protein H2248_007084 [Termitomyces sp. 'cryptogamus']|nr:hypothetical protein H2248_007084 [Termitomyces sp. 'cryptogamus']